MRSAEVLPAFALWACAHSGPADPILATGTVAHELETSLVDGAEVVIPPFDNLDGPYAEAPSIAVLGSAVAGDGTVALAVQTWPSDDPGALELVRVGAATERIPLGGALELEGAPVSVGLAGGAAVVWPCTGEGIAYVVMPGAAEGVVVSAPSACYLGLGDANGDLVGAIAPYGEFDVRTWSVSPSGLEEIAAETLPTGGATEALIAGRGPGGAFVLGTTGAAVTRSDRTGATQHDAWDPRLVVPDGDGWLVGHGDYGYQGPTGPVAMHRWTPADGGWEARGTVDLAPFPAEVAPVGRRGLFAVEREQWGVDESVTVVTGAWWLAPVDGSYQAVPVPPDPCEDREACARIGEWRPAAVVDGPGGRRAIWIVWSWLGPSALVAAPF